MLGIALRAEMQGRSREQTWTGQGLGEHRGRRGRGADERGLRHSGPDVTRRPVIDGPVPYSVITRRVVPQTA